MSDDMEIQVGIRVFPEGTFGDLTDTDEYPVTAHEILLAAQALDEKAERVAREQEEGWEERARMFHLTGLRILHMFGLQDYDPEEPPA